MGIAREVPQKIIDELVAKGIKREKIMEAIADSKRMNNIRKEADEGEVDKEDLYDLVSYTGQMLKQVTNLTLEQCDEDPKFGIGIMTGISLVLHGIPLPAIITGEGTSVIAAACARFQHLAAEIAIKANQGVRADDGHLFCSEDHE